MQLGLYAGVRHEGLEVLRGRAPRDGTRECASLLVIMQRLALELPDEITHILAGAEITLEERLEQRPKMHA